MQWIHSQNKYYQLLSSKGYIFSRLIQWTDGCAAQYKCKHAFKDLTTMNISNTMERNFFGSRHGKNACDGEGAVIKRKVTQAVKSRRVVIQSASDFFAYCKTHLTKPDYVNGSCCHYRRDFILVESSSINRGEREELRPVNGIRLLHSIRSKGPYCVQVRSLTCSCHGCETGTRGCFNTSHVEQWKEVQLRKRLGVSGFLSFFLSKSIF